MGTHTTHTDTHWPLAICWQHKSKPAPPIAPSPENSVINEWHLASGFRPLQSTFQMIDTWTYHALRQLNATQHKRATSTKSTCGKLVYIHMILASWYFVTGSNVKCQLLYSHFCIYFSLPFENISRLKKIFSRNIHQLVLNCYRKFCCHFHLDFALMMDSEKAVVSRARCRYLWRWSWILLKIVFMKTDPNPFISSIKRASSSFMHWSANNNEGGSLKASNFWISFVLIRQPVIFFSLLFFLLKQTATIAGWYML